MASRPPNYDRSRRFIHAPATCNISLPSTRKTKTVARFWTGFSLFSKRSSIAIDDRIDRLWQLFNPDSIPEKHLNWLAAWLALVVGILIGLQANSDR